MTLGSAKAEIFRRLEEDPSSPVYWSVADVVQALNEGYLELSDISEWKEVTQAIDLSTSTYYNLSSILSSPFLYMRRLFNNSTSEWLTPDHWRRLNQQYREWRRVTGAPSWFLLRGLWWLGLYPKSASAVVSGLTAKYAALPDALTADGQSFGVPEEFVQGILDYACYDLLCQEREFKKAMRYWRSFGVIAEAFRIYVEHRITTPRPGMLGGAY